MDRITRVSILNAILVNEGVRPAMLVQPADNQESTGEDKKTKSIISEIKRRFPELIQSEKYDSYQGVIISKTENYTGRKDISLELMGEILGYPCSKEFKTINTAEDTFVTMSLHAKLENEEEEVLFANFCKDDSKMKDFSKLRLKAKKAFGLPKYKTLFDDMNIHVNDVDIEIIHNPSLKGILNKFIRFEDLDEDEKSMVVNTVFNFGFSEEGIATFIDTFQYTNPVHIGIAIDLLVRNNHDTLSPFFPLQKYPTENKKVDIITEKWERELLDVLEKTKTKSSQQNGGNGHFTKKTKRRRRGTKVYI